MDQIKKIRVGLLGFGNIGGGVVTALEKNAPILRREYGVEFEIARVLVRDKLKKRTAALDPALLTEDPDAILDDPSIALVAEFMGGVEPAAGYLVRALERGKSVVTANKNAVATRWDDLWAAAKRGGAGLYFEASAAGGIPIVLALTQALQANDVARISGIVNGTTNYILSRMRDEGLSYGEVLADAQALGYAEPDPTFDVDGTDAAYKLSILSSLAFRAHVPMDLIGKRGIMAVTPADMALGRELGLVLKLLATAKKAVRPDGAVAVSAGVEPVYVPEGHPLAAVKDAFNAVYVTGDMLGDAMFYGRGAGPLPTASAVVSDMARAARRDGFAAPAFTDAANQKRVVSASAPDNAFVARVAADDEEAARARLTAARIGVSRSAQAGAFCALETAPCGYAALEKALGGLMQSAYRVES